MFVRWKYRRLRRSRDVTCKAVLVRTVWCHGQPRQHIVCYLAAIHAQHQQAPAHRQAFWEDVEQRLARVPLDAATRQRVVHQLATRIPPPTVEELQQVLAQQVVLQELATQLGYVRDTCRKVSQAISELKTTYCKYQKLHQFNYRK